MGKVISALKPDDTVFCLWYGKLRVGKVIRIFNKAEEESRIEEYCEIFEYPHFHKETYWGGYMFNEAYKTLYSGAEEYERWRISQAIERIRNGENTL